METRSANKTIKAIREAKVKPVHLWLVLAVTIIIALSLYWQDTPLGIISAATGVICVILTADGKRSSYVWGLVNCATYAYIAYTNGLYGETMLNTIYYIPMQFIGFYTWSKHMNNDENTVQVNKVSKFEMLVYIGGMVVGVFGYAVFLNKLGDPLPLIDSTTTILSIFAAIFQVRRLAEQWILWIIIDVISVAMWGITMYNGSENVGTLIMWVVYLINAIYGWVAWKKHQTKEVKAV